MRIGACALLVLGLIASDPAVAGSMTFEDFVIEGEVLKPEVTIVISRENLNKPYFLELKESFLQKIIDALEHHPF
jgi:hypothetical protein